MILLDCQIVTMDRRILLTEFLVLFCLSVHASEHRGAVLVLYSSEHDNISVRNMLTSQDNIELIYQDLKNSDCKFEETRAVGLFIEEVFVNMTDVVATIGPSCTDAAYAISSLISRREVSMIHLHTSPLPATLAANLNNSFGLLGPIELLADASIELIRHSKWSQVMALYQDTNTEMNAMFDYLQKQLSSDVNLNKTLEFSAIIYEGYIPLKFILSKFAIRIIFLMLDPNLARNALCLGYHLNAVYPHYQWVVIRTTLDDIVNSAHFHAEGYTCNREDILLVLQNALFIDFHSNVSSTDALSKCINSYRMNLQSSLYQCTIKSLNSLLNTNHNTSLELAIDSLQQPDWLIAYHQLKIDTYILASIYFTSISLLEAYELVTINTLPIIEVVSTPLAVVFFLSTALIVILMLTLHILSIIFRHSKSVKANSLYLLTVGYFGGYIVATMVIVYFIQKTVYIVSDALYVHLCQTFLLVGTIGLTLVSGTCLVRTWRLYQIFIRYKNPARFISDAHLIFGILCMTTIDFFICLIWFVFDPIKRMYIKINVDPINGRAISRAICHSQAYPMLLMLVMSYQLVPVLVTCWFSYLLLKKIPKSQSEFRSNLTIKFVYVVLFIFGLGSPLYLLFHYFLQNLQLEFVVLGVAFNGIMIAACILLFLPPLVPVAKKYLCKH